MNSNNYEMGVSFDVWTEVVLDHASARVVRRLQQQQQIHTLYIND